MTANIRGINNVPAVFTNPFLQPLLWGNSGRLSVGRNRDVYEILIQYIRCLLFDNWLSFVFAVHVYYGVFFISKLSFAINNYILKIDCLLVGD